MDRTGSGNIGRGKAERRIHRLSHLRRRVRPIELASSKRANVSKTDDDVAVSDHSVVYDS